MDISEDIIDNSFAHTSSEVSDGGDKKSESQPSILPYSHSEIINNTDLEESMVVPTRRGKKPAVIYSSDEESFHDMDISSTEKQPKSTTDISDIDEIKENALNNGEVSKSKSQSLLKCTSPTVISINSAVIDTNQSSLGNSNGAVHEMSTALMSPATTGFTDDLQDAINTSAAFTVRRARGAQVIQSDTESEDETNVDLEDVMPVSPDNLQKQSTSRMSANFKHIKSGLCSTMVDLPEFMESGSEDIIDVSDDDVEVMTKKVPTIVTKSTTSFIRPSILQNKILPISSVKNTGTRSVVDRTVYSEQKRTVQKLEMEVAQVANILRTMDLSRLPDKGKLLNSRHESLAKSLQIAQKKLENMVPSTDDVPPVVHRKPISWEDIKVESDIVQPKTMGQRALQTYNVQKSLTMERLQLLHGSLANCPTEDTLAEDPKGLRVELMAHQKHALAWLFWREKQQPSGGILADDMGLGKTLTMISLMLKSAEEAPDRNKENEWKGREKELIQGGTLIVCPASLVKQWEAEVAKHCKRGLINIDCYHGPKREQKAKYLAKYDMVITTYTICQTEMEKSTPLFRINWRRIILDEGHQIRNHKSRTSTAVCQLEAKSRWILTGTPIQNKELDMYALMKFLHCTPFDDYAVWKMWIANKDTGGYQRLQTVISSLMLRRTKVQLQEVGALKSLPQKTWKVVNVKLSEDEMAIYEKVLVFSRTIFAQYLHQRSNKGTLEDANGRPTVTKPVDPNSPYYKIYEKIARRCKEVKQHEILMVLLRLRQCCCHPSLIIQMLEKGEFEEDDDTGVMNLMEELGKLDLEDNERRGTKNVKTIDTKRFNIENPLFSKNYKSQKVATILEAAKDITEIRKEKVIIVSQWTSFLKLIGGHLKTENIRFEQLDGTLNIEKRMEIVQNMNNSSHPVRVLLLSLTAGGVGLNLVGANHLLLVDIHWNPQLELQAQDRIYRVGQQRPVNIYKLITKNTIEEQVKKIQDYKLSIADSMLTGAKVDNTKLSLQDLRMLFNM